MTLRIAFVCSGNICRSPMAAALAPDLLEEAGHEAMILSAGTLHIQGRRAATEAQEAVAEIGLDLSGHRSQGADPNLMRFADHVIIMSPRHRRYFEAQAPDILPKVVDLWRYAGDETLARIPDPVGMDLEVFRNVRDLIADCLRAWIQTLPPEG